MRKLTKTAIAIFFSVGMQANGLNAADYTCCDNASCDSSCCDSCDACDSCNDNSFCDCLDLFSDSDASISGWMDAGFIGNTSSPNSRFNGPYNAVDRSNEAMLNQIYLIAEKELPRCGHGIGGRIDYLYGEDYFLAESIGIEKRQDGSARWNNEYYGSAFPQAFVSLGNQELSMQIGHFYSVVGYEGVMAPDNFFYSKSYSYQFAGPFTHWGAQANWKPSTAWTVQAGLHNGWDAFDRVSDSVGFVGKVRYDLQDTGSWTSFAITTGEDYNDSAGVAPTQQFSNRTRYSWLVGLPLTCKLDYVFHHWLGFQEAGAPDGGQADWYGIDQYLTYKVNRCTNVGMRFEWFRDEEGTRVGLNRPSNPNTAPLAGSFCSFSFGANYSPMSNVTFRPELRADWFDGAAGFAPYNDGTDDSQFMLGCDVILRM
jgi:hypothetical protein